jgi:hypothetical protein
MPNSKNGRLGDKSARGRAYEAAAACCARLAGDAQESFVNDIEHDLEVEPVKENLMMTWDQARQLIRQGHMVGSHGMSHPNLAHIKATIWNLNWVNPRNVWSTNWTAPSAIFLIPVPPCNPTGPQLRSPFAERWGMLQLLRLIRARFATVTIRCSFIGSLRPQRLRVCAGTWNARFWGAPRNSRVFLCHYTTRGLQTHR